MFELIPSFVPLQNVLLTYGSPERSQKDDNGGFGRRLFRGSDQVVHVDTVAVNIKNSTGSDGLSNIQVVSNKVRGFSFECSLDTAAVGRGYS